jgi:hypothetical protein
MARVALTPTNLLGTAGLVLPATGAQTLATFTGVSFTNNGLMFLAVYIGSSGAGNLTFNIGRTVEGQAPAPIVVALSNSTNYLFGPWSPTDFTAQDGSGLTYFDFSVSTGNSATLYQLSPSH